MAEIFLFKENYLKTGNSEEEALLSDIGVRRSLNGEIVVDFWGSNNRGRFGPSFGLALNDISAIAFGNALSTKAIWNSGRLSWG